MIAAQRPIENKRGRAHHVINNGGTLDETRAQLAAVWRPRDEWATTASTISHFTPTGEPDAPYETYARHI